MITPETGSMTMGLGGFQETEQLPIFSKITKYQGHVMNPKRIAEITSRCFDRALLEMGTTQLNIPRDFFTVTSKSRFRSRFELVVAPAMKLRSTKRRAYSPRRSFQSFLPEAG